MQKFGIGQSVARIEDNRPTTGQGRFIDDINLDAQTWAVFVRSPHAHALIRSIDTEAASALPGVLGIYTVADLQAENIGNVPCFASVQNSDGSAFIAPPRPALAEGRVRHVGDAVAVVVAATLLEARDAAEQVWEQASHNRCFDWSMGDASGVAAALKHAAHAVELELVNNRVIPTSMELRGSIAAIEPGTGRLQLTVSCQGVHLMRRMLANNIFKVPEADVHVICDEVGGGFGMKIFLFPEYVATLFAARKLGRPVKWISERNEAFVSDSHGRDNLTRLQLALDKDARILGLKVDTIANLGACLSNFAPFVATTAGAAMLVGCYRVPAAHVTVQGVFTHTAPVDAYRGAGRPEAIYAIERLMDVAAHDLGLTPDETRRRNFIPPAAMPYDTCLGATYDSGEFGKNLEDALRLANWQDFEARRAAARARGKLRGIGLACYIERCSGGAPEMARLEVAGDGHVTLYIGTLSNGQGHETAFRQILSERLGIEFSDTTIVQGDSDRITSGGGTMGSRSVPVGAAAIGLAAAKIIDKAKQKAAEVLESAVVDVEFSDGLFRIVGTDRSVSFKNVALAAAPTEGGASFDESDSFAPSSSTYPNSTHICELESDMATAAIEVVYYCVVDDFGKVINPLLLEGQVHGGIGQGLGQALLENCCYDPESGQLLSATFMDYNLPRALNFPPIKFMRNEVPCTTNPLGIKGAGEAGAIGAPPAIINAIVNALREYNERHVDMPVTTGRMWGVLRAARIV